MSSCTHTRAHTHTHTHTREYEICVHQSLLLLSRLPWAWLLHQQTWLHSCSPWDKGIWMPVTTGYPHAWDLQMLVHITMRCGETFKQVDMLQRLRLTCWGYLLAELQRCLVIATQEQRARFFNYIFKPVWSRYQAHLGSTWPNVNQDLALAILKLQEFCS